MSSRVVVLAAGALLCALLLAASARAAADDLGVFALRSDRADDPFLMQALQDEDFSTQALICDGVGRRADPYAADIIGFLLERNAGAEKVHVEILLRMILKGLFDPARGEEKIRSAVAANADALGTMVSRIDRWTDPQLTSSLVRLLPFLPASQALPALLAVGSGLVHRLEAGAGSVPSQETGLAMDYLAAAEKMKCRDSFEQCAAMARLSREKVLVDRARSVARVLAAD
jgi:hypothetical protein